MSMYNHGVGLMRPLGEDGIVYDVTPLISYFVDLHVRACKASSVLRNYAI